MFNRKLKERVEKLETDYEELKRKNDILEEVINDVSNGIEIITLRKIKSLKFKIDDNTKDNLSYSALLGEKVIRISQVRNAYTYYDYIITLDNETLHGYYINSHLMDLFIWIENKVAEEKEVKTKNITINGISKSKMLL